MMTDQTPLTISLVVLQALCKIEVDIPESMDVSGEMYCEFEYANYFFDAINGDMVIFFLEAHLSINHTICNTCNILF